MSLCLCVFVAVQSCYLIHQNARWRSADTTRSLSPRCQEPRSDYKSTRVIMSTTSTQVQQQSNISAPRSPRNLNWPNWLNVHSFSFFQKPTENVKPGFNESRAIFTTQDPVKNSAVLSLVCISGLNLHTANTRTKLTNKQQLKTQLKKDGGPWTWTSLTIYEALIEILFKKDSKNNFSCLTVLSDKNWNLFQFSTF